MTRRELITSTNSTVDSMVKIAGTNYDRRRKVTNDMKRKMTQMVNAGKAYSTIAEHFNVSADAVRRNTDAEFNASEQQRKRELAKRAGYRSESNAAERAEYKRGLLKAGKKLIIG